MDDVSLRDEAIKRLKKKREFTMHLMAYILVNGGLIVIAAVTYLASRASLWELVWPIFPILGWGIGLFFHGLDVYGPGMSEDAIQQEMRRLRGDRS